jgi:hypothetical protein
MELIILLYMFFTGCIYASWLWDAEYPIGDKLLSILFGLIHGWIVTPILIGRVLRKFYKD